MTGRRMSASVPIADVEGPRVGELGEAGVLNRVLAHLEPSGAAVLGPGDDCAVLNVAGNLVVTTDTMIEGPDFRRDWHTPEGLGWKLAATNLSDVAAMGARPVALTAAFACPPDTPAAVLEGIAKGLNAACQVLAPGSGVVGGDLAAAPMLTAAITALGDLEGRAPVTRAGAAPGHVLAYAGSLGLSGLGLAALFAADADRAQQPLERDDAALHAHLEPDPPVALGRDAALAGATAMLDVSDGLALDASRLAAASRVRLDLGSEALRAGFGLQRGVTVPIDAMLYGGEDHGLLATFPADAVLPSGFVPIGTAEAGDGVVLDDEVLTASGWDPYAG